MKRNTKAARILAIVLSAVMVLGLAAAAAPGAWSSHFDEFDQLMAYDERLNVEIAEEGFVLLKNSGILPLAKNERMVTVLGEQADSLAYGGGGSGSQSRPGQQMGSTYAKSTQSTIFDSLEAAGFTANPRIRDRYLTVNPGTASVEGSMGGANPYERGHYMDLAENGIIEFGGKKFNPVTDGSGSLDGADDNLSLYGDAAIVVLARTGSEGADNPSHGAGGHSDPNEHYLTLTDSEYELLAYAKYHFEKVIVIINSPAVMELGSLQNDDGIGAILWVGQPGWNGIMAVGEILTGAVNPSGRTVDFWMSDFTTDPTWYNFGNYSQARYALTGEYGSGNSTIPMTQSPLCEYTVTRNQTAIDYAEGIWVGYRYYETVAHDMGEAGEAWYQSVVTYPFGYGLSYTTFEQEIVSTEGDINNKDGQIKVNVKVTNTGSVAGKEVVQLYSTPPYTAGGIDKSAVNLVGFAKTSKLRPGASEIVTVTIDVKDLASFDDTDRNGNKFCGYELETGDYILSIRKNSHEEIDSVTLKCTAAGQWDEDGNPDTPNNIFSQGLDSAWGRYNTAAYTWTESHEDHYLRRDQLLNEGQPSDLKKLAWLLGDDNLFIDQTFAVEAQREHVYSYMDHDNVFTPEIETNYVNPWTKTAADIPASWTQGTGVVDEATGMYPITLGDMIGVPYDDAKWDEFMNQLTWTELVASVNSGRYQTNGVANVGRAKVTDQDGPGQIRAAGDWAWVCEVVVASTWNLDLCYKQGVAVGNASIMGGVNGWYGPALDSHRNPLAGRNFEYYSQDPIQGGLIAAAVIKGAVDMGVHVYAKHAILNDQETSRMSTATFATEQAFRELYAKQFELTVKKGNCNGMMSAFNQIGIESSAGYAINQQLYRNEWGMVGYSVTDYYSTPSGGWMANTLVRGNTIPLGNHPNNLGGGLDGQWDAEKNTVTVPVYDAEAGAVNADERIASPTLWFWLRDTAKNTMYLQANLNGQKNGFYNVMIELNDALVLKQNEAVPAQTHILSDASREKLDKVFGSTGYTLTVTGLPAGVTVNSRGILSGVPTENGDARITVSLKGNYGFGHISGSRSFNTAVDVFEEKLIDGVKLDNATAKIGEAYTGQITASAVELTAENYVAGGRASADTVGKYIGIQYAATGLPQGLRIDANTGAITGTPTQVGTFPVNITANYRKVTATQGRSGTTYSATNEPYTSVYKFTVDGAFNVTFDANFEGGSKQLIGLAEAGPLAAIADKVQTPVNGANVFLGWATRANANAANVDLETAQAEGPVTYYAVWGLPAIAVIDGEWWVNGANTHLKVTGEAGKDGLDGQDGQDAVAPVITINEDGYWVINGEATGVMAKGEKGDTGAAGKDGANGKDGAKGDTGATGATGASGKDGTDGNANVGVIVGIIGGVLGAAGLGVSLAGKKKKD
ncbi:MAG: glycoside hydrolase family 3 C-terminal domain-containing protein [Lachnospiraceae bacterium]|nr:glycoside hydrolase family 3 C-terminal domain-containing protein [Lachnospiraceae bacterium]